MRIALKRFLILYFCLFIVVYYAWPVHGETVAEEARKLLEKGLTIHEIDRELARLAERELEIKKQIVKFEGDIREQESAVDLKRDAAGKVLRSIYMGQRERLYLAVLSMDNFNDAIVALDFMRMIFQHDQRLLYSYKESIEELKRMHAELLSIDEQLKDVKNAYLTEKDRLLRAQSELEEELAFLPADESELLRNEIAALTERWEREGIPAVEHYFTALAEVMQQLPQIVATNSEILQIRGSQFVFQITDEQLNDFLRDKNELFENLSFQFADDMITVKGEHNGAAVTIQGRYTLEQEPTNHIRYSIASLLYDELALPDTTVQSLEEQFDLSIYPDQFQISLEATEVSMEDNQLRIKLKAKGNWLDSLFGNLFS